MIRSSGHRPAVHHVISSSSLYTHRVAKRPGHPWLSMVPAGRLQLSSLAGIGSDAGDDRARSVTLHARG